MTSIRNKISLSLLILQAAGSAAVAASLYLWIWPAELLISFMPLLALALTIAATSSVLFIATSKEIRQQKAFLFVLAVALGLVLFLLFSMYRFQKPVDMTRSSSPSVTFATFNKLVSNTDTDKYIDYFKEQEVDILALQEVQLSEVEYVAEQLGFEYSHTTRTFSSSGGTAVALVSRYPFASVQTVELDTKHPVVRAVIQTPTNGEIAVYSVHIPIPSTNFLYNKRNVVLHSLAETLRQETTPALLGGDFNTTIYSPAMRSFSSQTNSILTPVETRALPKCSWYGFGAPLCIRIDHVFAPKSAQVVDYTVSPDLGSDHRAVIVKVAL